MLAEEDWVPCQDAHPAEEYVGEMDEVHIEDVLFERVRDYPVLYELKGIIPKIFVEVDQPIICHLPHAHGPSHTTIFSNTLKSASLVSILVLKSKYRPDSMHLDNLDITGCSQYCVLRYNR